MFLFSDDPLFTDEELFLMCAASGGKTVQDTATGNPLTFITDVSKPLKSLLIPFTPVQSGTGDPSPQNIRSILPWDGLKVFGGGKNLLKYTVGQTKQNNGVDYEILSDGGQSCKGTATATSYAIDSLRTVLHAGSYTVSVSGSVNMKTVIVKNGAYFRQISGNGYSIFSITEDTEIGCYSFASNGDTVDETIYVQLEAGQTATAYEPYHPITKTDIVFPSPVYGGTPDVVSGVLTVQRVSISKKWSEWEAQSVGSTHTRKTLLFNDPVKGASTYAWSRCNVAPQDWNTSQNTHFYIDENKAYVWLPNDTDGDLVVQVAGVLVTPQEIQLTPQQITALVGDNTIWSDADGSMTAVYLKKG